MAPQSAVVPSAAAERDPIADARALVAMAVNLGGRARNAHRLSQVTDRKASLYVNALVRHAARLLQSTATHDVPVLHASARGPGGNATHYVIRHDSLIGPPVGQRFLAVGSDARLRCCVVSAADGSRIWADYDVSSAPDDLPLRVVLDALSELIYRLEQAVTRLEAQQIAREAQLEADIASAKSRLSGMTATGHTPKRQATSEEPVRPWTRHVQPVAPVAPVAHVAHVAPAAHVAPVAPAAHVAPVVAAPNAEAVPAPEPDNPVPPVQAADPVQAVQAVQAAQTVQAVQAADPVEPPTPEPVSESTPHTRRTFKLSRLEKAI